MTHLASLRDFIDALEQIGEVQPIYLEVDWNLEIGAITRRSYELRAPAPLFNVIKGSERGLRVLGAPGGVSASPALRFARVALTLGFEPDTPARKIVESLAGAQSRPGIAARWLSTGPCKENVMLGKDIDRLRFAAPFIHASDGGRYIQTLCG